MANLIQRIVGTNLDETDTKIPVHGILAAFREWTRGKVTPTEVYTLYGLSAAQQTQIGVLASLWNDAPDKEAFMRTFKDLMYLGELDAHSRYRDITYIQTRLEEEVTDQGGTVS